MARIQIPIDALTSRLNLSDRFAGVRSQSLASRFANLKPLSEFFDIKRLSKPANFGEVQSRVNYNLGHFSSNYAVVFAMLSVYSLLTNKWLLLDIILVVGGMWGIGKLDGRDLDIGPIHATSSQLYTALIIVAVPIGFIASPFTTILWLIGASFFWGGGLGGRPRSPKSVPPWGRPPGAKGSSRRRQWEREKTYWQEARVQELDTDDTDTSGVGRNFEKKRFASDPLKFTGIDLAPKPRSRRAYTYETDSSSGTEDSGSGDESSAMQIALREKEEALVRSALARIRKAQEKGKREVKLNPEEVAALERRRKRMQAAATTKRESASSGGSGSERRRRKDQQLITLPLPIEPMPKPPSKKKKQRKSEPPNSSAPGLLALDGSVTPFGYYPPPAGSRTSPTRPRSASQSVGLRDVSVPQLPPTTRRHVSDDTRPTSSSSTSSRRPLPDDEDWVPLHSRRSSISSAYGPIDPFDYQTSSSHPPPIPSHLQSSSRRGFSGPPEVAYSSLRRSPPLPAPARDGGGVSLPTSNSDPTLRRRSSRMRERMDYTEGTSESSEDSQDDGMGGGVRVYLDERDNTEKEEKRVKMPVPSRKPVGGKKKGKGKG